jgi:sugar/nucleoside kinase (ribokinase family)
MSLVVVGSVAYDGVETPHGKVDRMLGGAATYVGLAASYFAPVKIVAVVGNDFAQEDVDLLASRRIDLDGLERVPGGKTFFWAGVYSADMNDRTTLRTDLNVFADFQPKLPIAPRPISSWETYSPSCSATCGRRCQVFTSLAATP